MQDDLDQLLDMLPADLGSLLINHPKRPQLIEVRVLWHADLPQAPGWQQSLRCAPSACKIPCVIPPEMPSLTCQPGLLPRVLRMYTTP